MNKTIEANFAAAYRIPDCTRLDYTDADEAESACRLLVALMQRTPAHRRRDVAAADSRAVEREAKTWLERIAVAAPALHCHLRLKALGGYDTLYRLTYPSAPVGAVATACRTDAFEARIRGDLRVDETELATALTAPACAPDERQARWLAATTDILVRRLARYSGFRSMPLARALKAARYLLERNLHAFTPSQDAFKERLSRLCLAQLTSLAALDSATLQSALTFVRAAKNRFIDDNTAFRLETELLHRLTDREDLPPLAREAHTLDLEYLLSDESQIVQRQKLNPK